MHSSPRLWLSTFVYLREFHYIFTDILRLDECWKYEASFTKVHREKVLVGSILMSFTPKMSDECVNRCLMMEQCKSINVRRSDEFCELNSKDTSDSSASVERRIGWDILETSDEQKNVQS